MHQDLATLKAGGYRAAGLTKLKLTESLADDGFPREILDLGDTLELLDLSGTGLAALPPDFGRRLPHLRIAFFSHCRFVRFPAEALADAPQLEMVAFRRNGMAALPEEAFGRTAVSTGRGVAASATPLGQRLRWLILTDNRLEALPASIGLCARLEKCMLAGNRLQTLPDAMAACRHLTLLRLAANRLPDLPRWLFAMPKLAFLSFAGNPCSSVPASLSSLSSPSSADASLSSSADASKTMSAASKTTSAASTPLPHVDWSQIEIHHVLGEGASGIISKGTVKAGGFSGESTPRSDTPSSSSSSSAHAAAPPPAEDVAIKIFRGALTSDGTPYDEMAACMAAGRHVNLVRVHGQVRFAEEEEDEEEKDAEEEEAIAEEVAARAVEAERKEAAAEAAAAAAEATPFKGGLVMELIPPHYRVLGQPPSFDTCTRDNFASPTTAMTVHTALSILAGVASAAEHLHARGIAHGDLYAHNILVRRGSTTATMPASQENKGKTHAILSDFGAATLYAVDSDNDGDDERFPHLEKLEVLAFAHLVEDVLGLMENPTDRTADRTADRTDPASSVHNVRQALARIHAACTVETVASRPTFASIVGDLATLQEAV